MFTSSIKGEIREFHVVVEQWWQSKIYREANLNLLLFCRSRWRRRCRCVTSVIVTIKHRHRFLFMYTFLGHVNTNPDMLKPNTWYLRLLEFGVVYPIWIHPPPLPSPAVSVVHMNSPNQSDTKKIYSGERCQKHAVSVCGFTDFVRTEGWRIPIKNRVCGFKNIRNRMERALYCHVLRRCFGRKSWKVKMSSSLNARSCSCRCAQNSPLTIWMGRKL